MTNQGERIERSRVEALDAMLGEPFQVLNDGFVRVIDYMGTDASIVQAARVSYGEGTKTVSDDRGLIRYLMRHRHTTPLEMCEIKLHVRVPMDCWRQWIRHRTANVNEYSTRYSVAIDSAQQTETDAWRLQAGGNRQGSEGVATQEVGEDLSREERELHEKCRSVYQARLDAGVAREQARKDLPLSTYTEAYWKIDLHNLFHFLSLRMERHAQQEIREYATVIGERIVQQWCPMAWEAFVDYGLKGTYLTRLETEILNALVGQDTERATEIATENGLVTYGSRGLKRNRERAELEGKLAGMGLSAPWLETPPE